MKEGGVCYVMLCYVCYVEICLSITSGTRGVGVSFHFLIEKGKKKKKRKKKNHLRGSRVVSIRFQF